MQNDIECLTIQKLSESPTFRPRAGSSPIKMTSGLSTPRKISGSYTNVSPSPLEHDLSKEKEKLLREIEKEYPKTTSEEIALVFLKNLEMQELNHDEKKSPKCDKKQEYKTDESYDQFSDIDTEAYPFQYNQSSLFKSMASNASDQKKQDSEDEEQSVNDNDSDDAIFVMEL